MGNLNWKAIVAGVVVTMGVGFLWYGLLFQGQWMAGNGMTLDGDTMFKDGVEVEPSSMPMIMNTISMIINAIFMNWLINKTGDYGWQKGGVLGIVIGIVMFIAIYVGNLFAMNPTSLTMVDGLYSLVLWTLLGVVIGALTKSNK